MDFSLCLSEAPPALSEISVAVGKKLFQPRRKHMAKSQAHGNKEKRKEKAKSPDGKKAGPKYLRAGSLQIGTSDKASSPARK